MNEQEEKEMVASRIANMKNQRRTMEKMGWGAGTYAEDEYECPTHTRSYEVKLMPAWIKCSERMPEINERVLVYQEEGVHGGNPIDIEYRECRDFWSDQGIFSGITHWMPLPQTPKE